LGAGKTSLLTRLARAGSLDGTLVLVNEAGEVSIDGALLRSARAEVVDLSGGAACCLYDDEDDLLAALSSAATRPEIRRIVLETSGLVHPAGLLDLLSAPACAALWTVTGFAVVVDVPRAASYLARFEEARAQVRMADRVAFTKVEDLASSAAQDAKRVVQALHAHLSDPVLAGAEVADLGNWLWAPRALPWPASPPSSHEHAEVFSLSLVDYAAYDVARVLAVLGQHLSRLLRVKGFVHVAGKRERAFLEWAGPQFEISWGESFGRSQPRTELVVIAAGDEAARSALEASLRACRYRSL